MILVTDATLVLKTSGKQALVYFCNALDGSPLANAKVKLWERWHDGQWRTREQSKETGADGIAVFELATRQHNNLELFASAILKDRQAFSPGNSYWNRGESEPWKIYAFTDRPAYRPKETVNWKFIARRYNGSVYSTPSDAIVEFEITDPRGAKVKADKAKLNAFGSAWGSLELTEAMPLGEYRVQFWDEGRKHGIGDATLFRLEEYKLPEFKVSVQTPEENGKRKAFRVGEKVEVTIQADYYFGGPVANASVEVIVNQNPYWQSWHRPREFPWFYEDMDSNQARYGRGYGGGQIVKRETLKTDATGKATLTFDTPANAGQDFEYRIEARVTDASRREIAGSGNVRVTRQRYYVYPQAEHNLYRPQDKVRVDFKALDANEQPVQTEGTVKVTRDYWYEIWIKPDGTEVKGEELKALQAKTKIWPPAPERPDQKGWRLKFRGYEHDEILTPHPQDRHRTAWREITFTPEREGYYRVAWLSEDVVPKRPPQPIRAETTVWVASEPDHRTRLSPRRRGDHRGQGHVPRRQRSARDARGQFARPLRAVHRRGRRPLPLPPRPHDRHGEAPGFVRGREIRAERIPERGPGERPADVHGHQTSHRAADEEFPDRGREAGSSAIPAAERRARSPSPREIDEGKPVSAEVAFSLVDESVFYIQSDYAGDPRQFYFGTKRGQQVQTQSTMNQKSYAKLVKGEKDELIEEREQERRLGRGRDEEADSSERKTVTYYCRPSGK